MAQHKRGQEAVLAVNTVVAVTVLALVAVLALVVNPPAPPGIAAFAPQASKPITKALPGQSTRFGNGAGECAAGQVCSGSSATPSASRAPGATAAPGASPTPLRGALPPGLQCYEWPDGSVTQTFDPQSPPCVSRWDGTKGNGGATSPGVTPTEIKVAFPVQTTSSTSSWPGLQPIVDFFNTRFQLYDRHITIVPVPSQQADGNTTGKRNDPTLQKADAAQIAKSKVFATLDFVDPIGQSATLPVFLDDMQRAKIVSINGGDVTPFDTAQGLAKRAPYAWSYYPTIDRLLDNVATLTCRQLVGKPALHAGDQSLQTKTRKFAVLLPTDEILGGPLPGLNSLLATLDGCGVHNPKIVREAGGAQGASANTAALQQLKADGVTSVIYLPWGGNGTTSSPLVQAQGVSYYPEWVVIGDYNYNTAYMLNDPPSETKGAFGVGTWNKQPGLQQEPWAQAALTVGAPPDTLKLDSARPFYQELMLLASGLQMAGPNLTPQTFADALHTTQFPNPGGGREPFFQGTVGFAGDDTVMVDDYTAFWLDTRTTGQQVSSSPGINQETAFCMVARGQRWNEDTWPRADRFYQSGVCR